MLLERRLGRMEIEHVRIMSSAGVLRGIEIDP